MAVGNTFGATALSSFGGFWIAFAIVLTPGGFQIEASYAAATGGHPSDFANAFGFFLMGWFIFTFILVICTLRSTVAFFLLFFTLDMAFLLLSCGYLLAVDGVPKSGIIKAGGWFGLFAAFAAWYNALAGIADSRYVSLSYLAEFNSRPRHIFFEQFSLTCILSTAIPSSSFPSSTSHGPRKAGSGDARARPSAKLFNHSIFPNNIISSQLIFARCLLRYTKDLSSGCDGREADFDFDAFGKLRWVIDPSRMGIKGAKRISALIMFMVL